MDSWGDSIETQFTGNELAKAFDEFGELEGEMMDVIISAWKADPLRNHVFASGQRVLLSPNFLSVRKVDFLINNNFCCSSLILSFFVQYCLEMDNMTSSTRFDVDRAVRAFPKYLKPGENLLNAKLVR